MNRLAQETSPYLLQHASNPVDWYPWGEEALERARAEDKPILLSIGYSACHWCHVMERESFENAETAALMNELYVNIKVDREERPDLDSIYMDARNTGYAAAWAALDGGASVLDASVGGLGGCPFSPNATGNVATEDLVWQLERDGIETVIDVEADAEIARWLAGLLGHELDGYLHRAARWP